MAQGTLLAAPPPLCRLPVRVVPGKPWAHWYRWNPPQSLPCTRETQTCRSSGSRCTPVGEGGALSLTQTI